MEADAGAAVLSYAVAAIADEAAGPGELAAALAALCDVLAVASEALILALPSPAALAKRLPALVVAGGEAGGDVPLLAARAIAEAVEGAPPHWAARLAGNGAVEALRDRLLAVECIELAEECLRALDAISLERPDDCLRLGVAAAVLQFFDFFSVSKQKVALRIVSNIFNDYDEDYAATAMEAVPALCNLLQSADKTVLGSALSCLAMVAAGASGNVEHMGKLCDSNDILGLLKSVASVSAKAVKSLFELDVCELLGEMISYYSCSNDANEKVKILVELMYQLMPPLKTSDQHAKLVIAKKNVIMEQRTYINQLATVATLIVQIAKSSALSSICYNCVIVIGNIVELSTDSFLMELQKTVNLSRLNVHAMTPPTENPDSCKQLSDLSRRLLSDKLPVTSTFEFVESGSIKYLADYLSNGACFNANMRNGQNLLEQLNEVRHRLQKFTCLALAGSNESSVKPLGVLVEKLLDALHMYYDSFPVMLSDEQSARESMVIPLRFSETQERTSLELKFQRSYREKVLERYKGVLSVDLFSTPEDIEPILWPHVCKRNDQEPASKNQEREANQSRRFVESENGTLQDIRDLDVAFHPIPRHQFMSNLLTKKLELQMQDSLFEDGLIPSWCVYLVETCPFLLPFDTRWKYFCLTAHQSFFKKQTNSSSEQVNSTPDQFNSNTDQVKSPPQTKRYRVTRGAILEDASSLMINHCPSSRIVEVEFAGEVGTGRGPTFEFYTTVSHELQRDGLGMWRGENGEAGYIRAPFGLFPKPWFSSSTSSQGVDFSNVVKKFKLLGHLVARAVLDGRILDIPLSKAFYKIMLEQELDMYDIPLIDPELGKAVIEFQALVERKKFLETSTIQTSNPATDLSYKNVTLDDLCLYFTLPGNPEYELVPGGSEKKLALDNLEEYVSSLVDATVKSGIATQIEAFKSGINEVFALKTLKMFTEEEMERILCGEQDAWASKNLEEHIEFEHGYDTSSPSIITFLEILREFGREEQRAFIQFTTGAPQLPLGGLASLDPKLTVVRKQCDGNVDDELPSVNTCRHFIKLPPYSSKEIMRKKLKYALVEGLGSFHLS
ncbi:hypothetical protein PR202_ga11084 [Eleusine coracana subsp. coracana]|uniref:HECT-type E3 ubiquitin transferase n=1 Tax=Eleusine coracana subsp. coracana TaxID=191504 RepID=A0AAV5C8P1_ELECO|nr:hypothetical protein PR202_ga11084 [Eleusine coracana subsp. coracana]